MVLKILAFVALATSTMACKQSLFEDKSDDKQGDDTGDDGGPGSDASVPATCEAPCVGDGAGEFDGTASGSTMHWRYVEDMRDRAWTPMPAGTEMIGSGGNKISKCDGTSGADVCTDLPGALLVSTVGATGPSDPAIEFTAPEKKVLKVSFKVRVPAGGKAQVVRLYRSSREDSLITDTAIPGTTLDGAIEIDALATERVLLAIAPTAGGQDNIGVQFFITDTEKTFPQSCQLAQTFETATGTQFANPCGTAPVDSLDDSDTGLAPSLVAGPFTESGKAEEFAEGRHLDTTVIADHSGDWTAQFWWKNSSDGVLVAFALSDIDQETTGGGFTVDAFLNQGEYNLEVISCTDGTNNQFAYGHSAFSGDGVWHFIRVVQKGANVNTCVDSVKVSNYALPVGHAASSFPLRMGRNGHYNPQESELIGALDDVRYFKNLALPCE
ncbi:MAG TPA: LamG-like jellyroll fold domain-containing protein [Kofleriaceae bacterium]